MVIGERGVKIEIYPHTNISIVAIMFLSNFHYKIVFERKLLLNEDFTLQQKRNANVSVRVYFVIITTLHLPAFNPFPFASPGFLSPT